MAEKRTQWVHVKATPDEHKQWQALAAAQGLSLYTMGQEAPEGDPNQERGIKLHAADGAVQVQSQQGPSKIAALGIRVRRGCSFHGLAFNIAGESVAPFSRINPCGFTDRGATSIERETGAKVPMDDVKRLVVKFLSEILNVRIYK